jgi:hypothetical protein
MPNVFITRSGFLAAVNTVKAYFESNGVTASVDVGWKKRTQQINQGPGGANRVVFTPSASDDGDAGELLPVRFPGDRNIRTAPNTTPVATVKSLLDWKRAALVSVWGVDQSDKSEAAQIEATEALFEWVVRAVHAAPGAFGAVEWGAAQWTVPAERSFGLELRAGFTFSHPIFDKPRDLAFPTTGAVVRGTYVPPVVPTSTGDS